MDGERLAGIVTGPGAAALRPRTTGDAVYDEIVVPLDLSPESLRAMGVAMWLQWRTGGRLVVVSTVSDPAHVDDAEHRLRAMLPVPGPSNVVIEVAHHDDPAACIAATAERTGSVICMATRGHGRAVEAVAGSVARGVLARTTRPVVLVGPHVDPTRSEWDSLVACTDETEASSPMLAVAADWAVVFGLALWITNVRPRVSATAPLALRTDAPPTLSPSYPDSDLVRIAADLRRPGLEPNWDALHDDDPASAIVRYAGDRPTALLALGTSNRHGLARIVLGSVAQRVVHDSPTPVLVVAGPPAPMA
jgi:nucleotide-binding universal stress UspA family protein